VILLGDFANGKDSQVIDLLIIAQKLDRNYLSGLIEKTETLIHRKISYIILNQLEYSNFKEKNKGNRLTIYTKDK
jgi:hypothetical protein